MPRRYTKAVIYEGGRIKTYSSVRVPALLPSHQNSDAYILRVGVLKPRSILVRKENIYTFPIGELERPQIVIGIAGMIAKDQNSKYIEETKKNKELEAKITALDNENIKLLNEIRKLRTESSEELARRLETILEKVADYKQKVAGQVA